MDALFRGVGYYSIGRQLNERGEFLIHSLDSIPCHCLLCFKKMKL